MLTDVRPVAAARYEPSSRILALLLLSATDDPAQASIVFCAFTPDFEHLQRTRELQVAVPGMTAAGPEAVPIYPGQIPFVLLPAVADAEGAGTASKVINSSILVSLKCLPEFVRL